MTALLPANINRLAKLLGMLGSDHLGERDNAGQLADKMVRAAGLTWRDIIAPPLPPHDTDPIGGDLRRATAACSRYPHLLNRWEADFVGGLSRFPRLSRRQRSILLNIVIRLRACGCDL